MKLKLRYYYDNPLTNVPELCTEIFADYTSEKIEIVNYTQNMLFRAFGINENPSWKQYEEFLEERCFPRTRFNAKDLLKQYGLENIGYDPLEIVKISNGRMAEDHMFLKIEEI